MEAFGRSLREEGRGWSLRVAGGGTSPLRVHDWTCESRPGDDDLLSLCAGTVLDVGCGPGRLTAALRRAGRRALGIDVAPAAVSLARARGAEALELDVFGPVPDTGAWGTVLLADGNIGIGGDPVALLRRCARLAAPGGRLVVELSAPPVRSGTRLVRLEREGEPPRGAWFPWAVLSVVDVGDAAARAGLDVTAADRSDAGRWSALLAVPSVSRRSAAEDLARAGAA